MPFEKGNQLAKGKGRKGYQYELEELKIMRKLFRKGLSLIEKMADNKASIKEAMAYGNIEKAILKIMDKFHANKQFIELSGEITEKVEIDKKSLAYKNFLKWRKQQKK